jgi:hypothetical protein
LYKEICQKILDLLKADETLSAKVKGWYFGFPETFQVYPAVAVEWRGGPVEVFTTVKERCEIRFEIAVFDANVKEDEAEKSVMDLTERVSEVLGGNPTLDGLVDGSRVVEVRSESGAGSRGIIVGALIMFTCYKTKMEV